MMSDDSRQLQDTKWRSPAGGWPPKGFSDKRDPREILLPPHGLELYLASFFIVSNRAFTSIGFATWAFIPIDSDF